MTNQLALILGAVIVALIGLDLLAFEGANLLFLARKLFVFIDYIAFWR